MNRSASVRLVASSDCYLAILRPWRNVGDQKRKRTSKKKSTLSRVFGG